MSITTNHYAPPSEVARVWMALDLAVGANLTPVQLDDQVTAILNETHPKHVSIVEGREPTTAVVNEAAAIARQRFPRSPTHSAAIDAIKECRRIGQTFGFSIGLKMSKDAIDLYDRNHPA